MQYELQNNASKKIDRRDVLKLVAGAGIAGISSLSAQNVDYVEAKRGMLLPRNKIDFNRDKMALLVANPQNDFLSPSGLGWGMYGASIKENDTVKNIATLLNVAKYISIPIIISHQSFEAQDYSYMPNSPFFNFIRGSKMLKNGTPGADFLNDFKQFVEDEKTIKLGANKRLGLIDDILKLELFSRDIKQVILCGVDADINVATYLRGLLSLNLSVAIIEDAIAGARSAEGDTYRSAMISFKYLASEVLSTNDFIKRMQ